MNYVYFIPLIILFLILFMNSRNEKMAVKKIITAKNRKENFKMEELAKRFINKECLLSAFNSQQYTGIIKEVADGAVLLESNDGKSEVINLEFIVRIREYPKTKNGKKKSVILD